MKIKKKIYDFETFCKNSITKTKKSGGFISELIAIGDANNIIIAFADLPETFEEKIKMFVGAGKKTGTDALIGKLQKLYFGTESWMIQVDKDEEKPDGYIRDNPNRVEILLLTEQNLENHTSQAKFYIMKRDSEEKLIDLAEMDGLKNKSEFNKTESPLLDAFAWGFNKGREVQTRQ